ncbi:MAG TPA: DUF4424 domain-containing protein [Caulobacter sp.]|nr:DUF4424 domain-containing protein [Caulobacter sp.]
MAGAVLALALSSPALANDTSAELAAGGLVITKNDAIEMQSEDLYISQAAVRVTYRFVNTSGRDVRIRVAFPMPDIGGPDMFKSDVSVPVDAPANILAFSTTADGKAVRTELEQKALADGVDRTAWLIANRIPLAVHQDAASTAIGKLSKAKRDEARELGLIDEEDSPIWVLRSTYHWMQTFPAGKPVTIQHRYTPSVGVTVGTMLGMGADTDQETVKRYCVDPSIQTTLARTAHNGESPRYTEHWIEYVLVTGGNWKKPIGDFRLTVDKGAPATLVSFCGDGVRKVAPTRFEMRKTNWRPEKDLSILFLDPYEN